MTRRHEAQQALLVSGTDPGTSITAPIRSGLVQSVIGLVLNVSGCKYIRTYPLIQMSYLNSNKSDSSVPHDQSMVYFNDCIWDLGLLEFSDHTTKFTWEREDIKEKLDWVFGNLAWEVLFPQFALFHDLKYKFDHKVRMLSCKLASQCQSPPKRFQYQAA